MCLWSFFLKKHICETSVILKIFGLKFAFEFLPGKTEVTDVQIEVLLYQLQC